MQFDLAQYKLLVMETIDASGERLGHVKKETHANSPVPWRGLSSGTTDSRSKSVIASDKLSCTLFSAACLNILQGQSRQIYFEN